MSNYFNLVKYTVTVLLLPSILGALALIFVTPMVFEISNLPSLAVAYPLELSLPFLGVSLLTPVYSPEFDPGILDTIRIRKMSYLVVCLLRIFVAVTLLAVCIIGFVMVMAFLRSQVTPIHALASFSNAIFLGGLACFVASLSRNVVTGYMFPVLYFILDLLGDFGPLSMFSMMRTDTVANKWILFVIGICCVVASLGWQKLVADHQ